MILLNENIWYIYDFNVFGRSYLDYFDLNFVKYFLFLFVVV